MKRKIIKILYISLPIILVLVLLFNYGTIYRYFWDITVLPKNKIEVTGNILDEENPYNYGNLCRIGDKLYYQCKLGYILHGILELSEHPRRVFGLKDPKIDPHGDIFVSYGDGIRMHNGTIYTIDSSGNLNYLYIGKKEFVPTGISTERGYRMNYFFWGDSIIYNDCTFDKYEEIESIQIVLNRKGIEEVLFKDTMECVFIKQDSLFIKNSFNEDEKYFLYEYNLVTKELMEICRLENRNIRPINIINNEWLVLRDYSSENGIKVQLFVQNIKNGEPPRLIYEENDVFGWPNYESNCIYVPTQSGLKRFNIETNEWALLDERPVKSCYIFDDKWIYLESGVYADVWRITKDGSFSEPVFKWPEE